jgi:CheY-like chemotaxis protein
MEKSKRILLVEDEVLIAMLEKKQLESLGYAGVHVASGEQAIGEVSGSGKYDLILMDIDLGQGIDGTVAAASFKE